LGGGAAPSSADGAIGLSAAGQLTLTPPAGFSGTIPSFSYDALDASDTLSLPATITEALEALCRVAAQPINNPRIGVRSQPDGRVSQDRADDLEVGPAGQEKSRAPVAEIVEPAER
jgi:hypothetical protein